MDDALLEWRRPTPRRRRPGTPWQDAGDPGETAERPSPPAEWVARKPRGNAWCRAHGRGYAAAVARRKPGGCQPVPEPGVLLAHLRSPDNPVRRNPLHPFSPLA